MNSKRTPKPMTHPFNGHVEFNIPRAPRTTARIPLMRPNPLNAHEVNRLVDDLDRAIDEAFGHVA